MSTLKKGELLCSCGKCHTCWCRAYYHANKAKIQARKKLALSNRTEEQIQIDRAYKLAAYHRGDKTRQRAQRTKQINAAKAYIETLKLTLQCSQCGEADSICLDFHHTNPKTKRTSISKASRQGRSVKWA